MSYDTPVRHLQGGSVLEVGAGGSVYMNGGQFVGTAGQSYGAIAHGTAVLTNGGSVFVNVGFTVRNAVACVVGLDGTAQSALISAARFANGSVNIYGLGTAFADLQRGTVSYIAFG